MDYLTYLTTYPHLYQAFSSLINRTENLSRYIQDNGLFQNNIRFFSIGAGEGELEIALARQYHSTFELLEPAKLFVDNFRQSLITHGAEQYIHRIHDIPFEDYQEQDQFDRVLSIHSWYSFGLNADLLEKALSMVKPGGYFLINLMSQKSPVYGLSNMSYSGGIDLCAEKLSAWAQSAGFTHDFSYEVAPRPASLFFDSEGQLTDQAKDFACFLVAKPWVDLSLPEHEKIEHIFRDHVANNQVNIVSGCLLFKK